MSDETKPEPKPLLTAADLAAALSISTVTVKKWRDEGCPHTVLGPKLYRFELDKVMAWAAARGGKAA